MSKAEGSGKKSARAVVYLIGFVLLALGIILNTKSDFGVTAVVSVPYSIHLVTGLNYGNVFLVVYIVYAAAEFAIKGKNFRYFDLLQIPVSLFITRLFNLFAAVLPDPESLAARIACMALGIIATGIGAAMMLHARFVPTPADGLVQAISDRTGRTAGFCKNCFDAASGIVTCAIGLLIKGKILGIGIGTVCAMLFVGRVIALYGRFMAPAISKYTGTAFDRGGSK